LSGEIGDALATDFNHAIEAIGKWDWKKGMLFARGTRPLCG